MIKFTKEEINLCKQIAEKDRLLKLAKEGDWIRNEYGEPSTELATNEYLGFVLRFVDVKHWFPLWTISDCLEFLREKEWHIVALTDDAVFDEKFQYHCEITDYKFDKHHSSSGKTSLTACLKAVLAVLEEGK